MASIDHNEYLLLSFACSAFNWLWPDDWWYLQRLWQISALIILRRIDLLKCFLSSRIRSALPNYRRRVFVEVFQIFKLLHLISRKLWLEAEVVVEAFWGPSGERVKMSFLYHIPWLLRYLLFREGPLLLAHCFNWERYLAWVLWQRYKTCLDWISCSFKLRHWFRSGLLPYYRVRFLMSINGWVNLNVNGASLSPEQLLLLNYSRRGSPIVARLPWLSDWHYRSHSCCRKHRISLEVEEHLRYDVLLGKDPLDGVLYFEMLLFLILKEEISRLRSVLRFFGPLSRRERHNMLKLPKWLRGLID